MTEVNVPLLRKAVEWVEEQDKLIWIRRQWNQGDWVQDAETRRFRIRYYMTTVNWKSFLEMFGIRKAEAARLLKETDCGTAYCVAGRIASWADPRYEKSAVVDGVHCSALAADLLGIPYEEDVQDEWDNVRGTMVACVVAATPLFNGCNSAAEVRQIAEKIAGEAL